MFYQVGVAAACMLSALSSLLLYAMRTGTWPLIDSQIIGAFCFSTALLVLIDAYFTLRLQRLKILFAVFETRRIVLIHVFSC